MKGMLYFPSQDEPVAVLDDVKLIHYDDNHKAAPARAFYKSSRLNAGRTMLELQRDDRMVLKLDDGSGANVVLQHSSMDADGNSVGVLRVLGPLAG